MTSQVEVLPHDGQPQVPSATCLRWPRAAADGSTDTVTCTLGWDLAPLGRLPTAAADLTRIAAAAYLADRSIRRPTTFTRTIELTAHTVDPEPWNSQPGRHIENLLAWLTGDQWQLTAVAAAAPGDAPAPLATADDIMLLSGGMDSLCGAADHLADSRSRIHLSHYDASTAIRHAQTTTVAWLNTHSAQPIRHMALKLCQTGTPKDSTSRSRSLLFAALATTTAAGASSPQVTVPENGFTSINPPLTAARGGALSTRSTHPTTFARLNEILAALDLPVRITNPYAYLTKGQMLTRAHQNTGSGVLAAASGTLSCSKLDGARYVGGNPNHNCGLCLACLVRRAAFTDGPYADPTPYLVDTLTGDARTSLLHRRRGDLHDVQQLLLTGIDDTDLLAVGDLPLDTDFDAVLDLCQRGLKELSRVRLP